jgi:hypothetical protein
MLRQHTFELAEFRTADARRHDAEVAIVNANKEKENATKEKEEAEVAIVNATEEKRRAEEESHDAEVAIVNATEEKRRAEEEMRLVGRKLRAAVEKCLPSHSGAAGKQQDDDSYFIDFNFKKKMNKFVGKDF